MSRPNGRWLPTIKIRQTLINISMLQTDNMFYNGVTRRTPTRQRPVHPNFSNFNTLDRPFAPPHPPARDDTRSLSPNKLNATKKPMIAKLSPQNGAARLARNGDCFSGQRNFGRQNEPSTRNYWSKNEEGEQSRCQNHPNKLSEFMAYIDGETIAYCQKCAINVASNGFEVSKISGQSSKDKMFLGSPKSALMPFNFPEYTSTPGYDDLKEIVQELDEAHSRYSQQLKTFSSIEDHYENQYNLTQSFYEELLKTIEEMKEDHLNDLVEMSKKHIQLAYIKEDHLKSDVEEMEVIRNDIFNSLEIILENFQDPLTQKNLTFYKQQIYSYADKIDEEKAEFSKELINYKPHELKARMALLEDYLLDVWDLKLPAKPDQQEQRRPPRPHPITQEKPTFTERQQSPMNNILHLGTNSEPRKQATGAACRKLFEQSETENDFLASPQFKNI